MEHIRQGVICLHSSLLLSRNQEQRYSDLLLPICSSFFLSYFNIFLSTKFLSICFLYYLFHSLEFSGCAIYRSCLVLPSALRILAHLLSALIVRVSAIIIHSYSEGNEDTETWTNLSMVTLWQKNKLYFPSIILTYQILNLAQYLFIFNIFSFYRF